jgi:disulfide bond formation protein DsbB
VFFFVLAFFAGVSTVRHRTLLAACTLTAAIATAGSLYFSEALGLVPCVLCWYQRILMYPLVVVLGVATLEGRVGVWRTALPMSTLGTVVAAYHVVLQRSSGLSCGIDGSCGAILWRGLGVFTIPRLSLLAFLLVTLCVGLLALYDRGIADPLSLCSSERR